MRIENAVRTNPDYRRPGAMFCDIPALLGKARPRNCRRAIGAALQGLRIENIAGVEARGFILGEALGNAANFEWGASNLVHALAKLMNAPCNRELAPPPLPWESY